MIEKIMFIYMDESGDLGFDFKKNKTSQYFVMAFLLSETEKYLNKIVSQTFKFFSEKERNSHCGTLHCNKEKDKTRLKLLQLLQKQNNISIIIIKLNKKHIFTRLNNEKQELYNYVCNVLLNRLINKRILTGKGQINFIASRRETNKFMNNQFKDYVQKNIQQNHNFQINIEISSPQAHKGLQVVDFVSWAAFRQYEHKDYSYYDIIKNLIIEDYSLYEA